MKPATRTQLWVDTKVQGGLLMRVVLYWLLMEFLMGALAASQVALTAGQAEFAVLLNRVLYAFGPALLSSFILLPLVMFDVVRFSHRFAGPMGRLRREVKQIADGEPTEPIRFREGDFWYDLATEINRLGEEVRELRKAVKNEAKELAPTA
jgi:nitrogen fixation/metabolism regulation signal transduction histidine kinase